MQKPSVFLPAVKDGFYIDGIVFDLIEDEIPLFNKHLSVLVARNELFFKKGKRCGIVLKERMASIRFFFVFWAADLLISAIKRTFTPKACLARSEMMTR